MSGVRYAPSPTGVFHIGNLRTAWISWWWAKRLRVPWVVRFEDIDAPRVLAGAQDKQLLDMKRLGCVPDEIVVQTQNHARQFSLFEQARSEGRIYPCTCSRKEILENLAGLASAPHAEPALYTGHCRDKNLSPSEKPVAWRFRDEVDSSGRHDFIVARGPSEPSALSEKSFTPAYHWACAIDDFDGNYDLLVRAWDLAHATGAQRKIQKWLASAEDKKFHAIPVFHCSLIVQEDGHRLEKRTQGVTLDELIRKGWTEEKILRAFAQSYDPNLSMDPGEAATTLRLSKLFSE